MPRLPDLQQGFGRALLGRGDAVEAEVVDDGLAAADRLQIYANNALAMFAGALGLTYPVLRRRVGDGYFRQLAREYRAAHPSRRGDLHWVGERLPAFLADRLGATEYAWLADLARLEWACEEALVAANHDPVGAESLARLDPGQLEGAVLTLAPSLRCVDSPYPVFSVWQANQPGQPGDPVDLGAGGESVLVRVAPEGLELRRLPQAELDFVRRLAAGETLGAALDASGIAADDFTRVLGWLFGDGLVSEVRAQARR